MKKLLPLIILIVVLGLGGMYWYSQTEVVVDEPAPTVPSTEETADDTEMSMEEKLEAGMVDELFPEDFEPAPETPAEVEAMMEKAADTAMTEEEKMAMEKEAVEMMNDGTQEITNNRSATIINKGMDMMEEDPEEGQEMMDRGMESLKREGLLMTEEEMEEKAINRQGVFAGADAFHQVSGSAIVIPAANTVRLENFNSTNGPDLRVSAITKSGQRVDLGALKGNVGNQNYTYSGVEAEDIASIQIWCRAFNVTFGTAVLN